jgi:hypothetical protein
MKHAYSIPAAALSMGLLLGGCGESTPAKTVTAEQLQNEGCKAEERIHVAGQVALLGKKSEWIPYPVVVPVTKVESYYDSQSKSMKTRTTTSTEIKISLSEVTVSTYDLRGENGIDAGIRIKDKEGGLYIPNLPVVPAFDSTYTDKVEVTGIATGDSAHGCTIAAEDIQEQK